jgi:hypothetical protein
MFQEMNEQGEDIAIKQVCKELKQLNEQFMVQSVVVEKEVRDVLAKMEGEWRETMKKQLESSKVNSAKSRNAENKANECPASTKSARNVFAKAS